MALVLSERDYKMVTLFSKIAGIFTFAAGTIMLFDHGRVVLSLVLILLGTGITLAPVPLTMVRPDTYDEVEKAELLTIDE